MMMLGGEEEESKSSETELSGDIAGRLNVLLSESDDESDFSNEGLITEEKLEEIMQELYREIQSSPYNNTPPPTATLTTSPPSSSSPQLYLSSLPFFAVSDVKSESCGASMSDSASTVMAGIEFVGTAGNLADVKAGLPENELWVMEMALDDNTSNVVGGDVEGLEDAKMEGCDEGEVGDDQWLARVLGWGPLELEEWT